MGTCCQKLHHDDILVSPTSSGRASPSEISKGQQEQFNTPRFVYTSSTTPLCGDNPSPDFRRKTVHVINKEIFMGPDDQDEDDEEDDDDELDPDETVHKMQDIPTRRKGVRFGTLLIPPSKGNPQSMRRLPSEHERVADGAFKFGPDLFDYWNRKELGASSHQYVKPLMNTLKEEVTNPENEHKIDEKRWDELMEKAKELQSKMYKTEEMESRYAKDKPYYNQLFDIKAGKPMKLDHIMALILYSDTTKLQRYFKKHIRATNAKEKFKDIADKNRKFANWFRLLYEAIWLYGDELKKGRRVFHGISFQPIFEKFEYNFNAPLSTTTDLKVAMDFCKEECKDGVILELVNGETIPQPYFDMEDFSEFSEEREYLFYGPTLRIQNIYIPDCETKQYTGNEGHVKKYNFYLDLLNGRTLTHIKKLKSKCKKVLELITKHMDEMDPNSNTEPDDSYMWRLFTYFTKRPRFWVNPAQLRFLRDKSDSGKELVAQLVEFDDDDSVSDLGPYLKKLKQNAGVKHIGFAHQFEWSIDAEILSKLEQQTTLLSGAWRCNIGDRQKDDGLEVVFRAEMFSGMEDQEEGMVGFAWYLDDSNKYTESLEVSVEIWSKKIVHGEFFNVLMSMKDENKVGVRKSGTRSMFPIDRLKQQDDKGVFNDFVGHVIIKAYAF